jgi:hypothetical protein
VVAALSPQIRKLPATLRRSLTWDRGLEMAKHKTFTVATDVKVPAVTKQSKQRRTARMIRQLQASAIGSKRRILNPGKHKRSDFRPCVSPLGPAPGTQPSHRGHCPSTVSADLVDPAPGSPLRRTGSGRQQKVEGKAHVENDPATPKPRLSGRATKPLNTSHQTLNTPGRRMRMRSDFRACGSPLAIIYSYLRQTMGSRLAAMFAG